MALVSHVHVRDPRDGQMVALGPADEVPLWAAKQMGAHCFEDGVHPFPESLLPADEDSDSSPDREDGAQPPKTGKGSSKGEWFLFAVEHDVDVTKTMGRNEIIAACVAAGVAPPD